MVKMVMRPKKMMEWTRIEAPLVCIFPNSTIRPLAGIWKSSPGVKSTNSITAITTGPQSAITLMLEREWEGNSREEVSARERERERLREVFLKFWRVRNVSCDVKGNGRWQCHVRIRCFLKTTRESVANFQVNGCFWFITE